jgi:hypothetical protein
MRNLQSRLLDFDEPEPLSRNRRLEFVMRLSTLDEEQLAMLSRITPAERLPAFFTGKLDLLADELSRLAVILRDALRQQNDKRLRLQAARHGRKNRKARSPEETARSLTKARAAKARKVAAIEPVANISSVPAAGMSEAGRPDQSQNSTRNRREKRAVDAENSLLPLALPDQQVPKVSASFGLSAYRE